MRPAVHCSPGTIRVPLILALLGAAIGCSGEERIVKTGAAGQGLEILAAGLEPEQPVALERPIAWALARDASSVEVQIASVSEAVAADPDFIPTADLFEAHALLNQGSAARAEYRWEVELPPRPADRILFYRFVAEGDDGESLSFPPGSHADAVPIGPTPFVLDFEWPGWGPAYEPFPCLYDAERFDLDFAAPGAPFQELNDPIFVREDRASILGASSGTSEGVGIEIEGQPYFFPLSILLWQEVVNISVGDRSGVVSYCPLTDTALFFLHDDTHIKTKNWEAGGLFNSNLVLVDLKEPLSQVPQMLAWGVKGRLRGQCVDIQPAILCDWKIWGRLYPDTKILNGDRADFDIDWLRAENVYRLYWRDHSEIRFPVQHLDEEHPLGLQNKSRMIGIFADGQPIAIPFEVDGQRNPLVVNLDRGRPMVVFTFPGAGFAGVFDRRHPDTGTLLNFKKANASWNSYRLYEDDQQPASLWTPTGVAVAGPFKGTRLTWVPSMRAFWFAWYAMYPESEIVDPYAFDTP